MKTIIISCHFNNIDYIDLQYKSFKKFLKFDYEYVVFNDAKLYCDYTNYNNNNLNETIKLKCYELDIKCIDVPQNIHKERTILFPDTIEPTTENAVTRCADSIQYAFNYYKNSDYDYLLIIDSDMFFIEEFDIETHMKEYNLAGVSQSRNDVKYLWNGIIIYDLKKLENLNEYNFDCGVINKNPVDVGGHSYFYLNKYKNSIKLKYINHSIYTYKETVNKDKNIKENLSKLLLELCELREDKSCNKELLLNNKILHIRSGGNWDRRTKEYQNEIFSKIYNYIINL